MTDKHIFSSSFISLDYRAASTIQAELVINMVPNASVNSFRGENNFKFIILNTSETRCYAGLTELLLIG